MRALLFTLMLCMSSTLFAASCLQVSRQLNSELRPQINADELRHILDSLNHTGRLPEQFVTKNAATRAGWQPGSDLHYTLPGKSIGGDRFGNYGKRLPYDRYQEADLDYRGGRRGAKRIVFSHARRYVTVDHYRTFHKVPPCQ